MAVGDKNSSRIRERLLNRSMNNSAYNEAYQKFNIEHPYDPKNPRIVIVYESSKSIEEKVDI
jgi:hypothetical protein